MKKHVFIVGLTSAIMATTPCYAQANQLRGSFKSPETDYEKQSASHDAAQLAKRAFLLRELNSVTPNAAETTNYRILIDAAIGRQNRSTQEELQKAIKELGETSPVQSGLFRAYFAIQSAPPLEIRRDPTLQHILDEYDSKNWKDRYLSRLLMSVLSLKRRDITQGLETANDALKDVPEDIAGQERYEYLYDIYTVINTGFILDKNMERALGSSAHVLELAEKANLKPDAFNISNNLAALYSNRNQIKTATGILKTGAPYLHSANDQQRVIYNYTLGTLLLKDNRFSEAEPFLQNALALNPPKQYTAAILAGLSRTASESGSLSEAKTLLGRIEHIRKAGLASSQLDQAILSLKSSIAAKEQDFEKAYGLQKQWSSAKISLLNEEVYANRQESANKISVTTQLAEQRLEGLETESNLKDTIIEREKRLVIFLIIIALLMMSLLTALLVGYLLQRRANKNLAAARDDAIAGEKAKSEFLQTLSHEFSTPLNAIIPIADLIKDSTPNKQHRTFAGLISANGTALLHMIENILKITKGRSETAMIIDDINPTGIITDIAKLFEDPTGRPNDIEIEAGSPDIDSFPTNTLAFKSIITNLLSNAVKFTPEGAVKISISRNIHNPEELHVTVVDKGIGMDPALLGEYQKPFTTADGTIMRQYEGVGIGLAVVNLCVEQCRARADCTTALGQGTRWDIYFPPLELTAVSAVPTPGHFLEAA